jgi:hypothetical protein
VLYYKELDNQNSMKAQTEIGIPKLYLPSFFSLSRQVCKIIDRKKSVGKKTLNLKLEILILISKTYVKVTAKGSPSGTATTTMVTFIFKES